jgi:O-antigen ligase
MNRSATGTEALRQNGLLIATAAAMSFLLLAAGPSWLLSGVTFTVIACGVFLLGLMFVAWASQGGAALDPAKAYLRLTLAVWFSLLVSAEAFSRITPESESFVGNFSPLAYGEAAFWALTFLALLLMPKPQYLRLAFSGCNKWLSLFALLCLVSALFSPTPLYSLAWAFKLSLVVLILLLYSGTVHDLDDTEAFFWCSLWGFAVLSVMPLARAVADPSNAFEGGRLSEMASPPGLAGSAATLVLLALLLNSLRKRIWLFGFVFVGAAVMIMSGGKAGIGGGIVSVTLFYLLQKRRVAAFGWLLAVVALGSVILEVTPLANYFTTYYEQGELSTITGRTKLWRAVWPEIVQHPIVGHGYLASRFVSENVGGTFQEAGHMHNGFLEALYNNGLIGLTIIVLIHLVIVRNLWLAVKRLPSRNGKLLAIGSWAIYVNLFVNGLFNASFGGTARAQFMLLLGLLVISEKLRTMADRALPAT